MSRLVTVFVCAVLLASCSGASSAHQSAPTAPSSAPSTRSTTTPAPPTTTTTPTTAPPTTTTTALPPGPVRAITIGDSLMYDAAPAIGAMLQAGGAGFRDQSFPGLGFSVPTFDWRAVWGKIIADNQPDVVIFLAGPWDTDSPTVNGQRLQYGSLTWRSWYDTQLDEFVGLVHGAAARLIWLTSPTYEPGPTAEDVGPINAAFRGVAARWPDVVVVETARVLAGPDGQFARYFPGPNGPVEARKADGLHLCPAGAARIAEALLPAVRRWWSITPAPGWNQGSWRSNERYAHPRYGAGCGEPAAG